MSELIQLVLTQVLVALSGWWILRQAFNAKPGSFLSWPMYNSVSFYRVHLVDDDSGESITPWDDQIHIDHGGDLDDLGEYLRYLREVRGVKASGYGIVRSWSGAQRVVVTASHVDLRGDMGRIS